MRVLVLNTGSSSIKYQLIESKSGERMAGGAAEEVTDYEVALHGVVTELGDVAVDAVGHRVVHGGERFTAPSLIDDAVLDALRALVPLAPLHNPANIRGIEVARRVWPAVPHVAVFDTAFHRTLPPHAYLYAVPTQWYAEHGVRRYGFHGSSHEFVSGRTAKLLGRDPASLHLIVAHLGNGASMAAIAGGRSIDTSMGLSPLEGLVMGSRSGDVDPTVITHVAAATGRRLRGCCVGAQHGERAEGPDRCLRHPRGDQPCRRRRCCRGDGARRVLLPREEVRRGVSCRARSL